MVASLRHWILRVGLHVIVFLFLLRCSAKPLLGHHTLVWMVGFRMAGFMLSGNGIRVFVLGNMGLGWVGKSTSQ